MSENPYDHEQDEHDYYYRQSEKRLKDFVFSFRAMLVIAVIFILIMLITSCTSAKRYPATSSIGYVISVDGDEVLVSFEVVTLEPGSQAAHWFYIPGHGYNKGDRYPDPAKDSSLSSPPREVGRGVKKKLP